jgi:hypothetical protein
MFVFVFIPHLWVGFIEVCIFCDTGLVVMNCFSLCLSLKVFNSALILKNNFAGYSNLGWHLFTYRA